MNAGMLHWNEGTPGGEAHVPFGGLEKTGIGMREMGDDGLNFFSLQKTCFESFAGNSLSVTR